MSKTIEAIETYTIHDCAECGVLFGLTEQFESRRRKDGQRFYCPNGHGLSYKVGETAEQKARRLERELANANETARIERAAANKAKRELAAAKRTITKAERAVCPVDGCQRSFMQMERHLRSKHPEFVHQRDGH
jgi:hypothetical protein